MGLLDKLFGKRTAPVSSTTTQRTAKPLGLVPLSREEEKIQQLLTKDGGREPGTGIKPKNSHGKSMDLESTLLDITPPEYFPPTEIVTYGSSPIERELRGIQSNLINLDDFELDERVNQLIVKVQNNSGDAEGQISLDGRLPLYDVLIEALSVSKFPKSRASLRQLMEADVKLLILRSQGQNAEKILSQLNCKNILEIAQLRQLQKFFAERSATSAAVAIEKVWEYQLTPAQFKFSKKVVSRYSSLLNAAEMFQAVSDDQIHYLDRHIFGVSEGEFRAALVKMRILREKRSQGIQIRQAFEAQFNEFLAGAPAELSTKLISLRKEDTKRWVVDISSTIVEYLETLAEKSGSVDRNLLEKERWALVQFIEKGMFNSVAELLEKLRSQAAQPRELAFELKKRQTRYFSKHPPFWVAIVEVIARDRDHVLIDGNLTGEGPLGGVPVQQERVNVSERIKENLKGKDFSAITDIEIAEKTERAVQLLGRKLSQTGNFLSLFYEALQSVKSPGIDEIELFPRSIRAIQTEDLDATNQALTAEGKELRPTEEEITSTLNNLEPIIDMYPTLREKGGLETFIQQRFSSLKNGKFAPAEAWLRRKEIAERLNIIISQVLMPWIKRSRENIENSLLNQG